MNDYIINLIRKAKDNVIIRYISAPARNILYERKHREYERSIEPDRIKKIKRTHEGESCFIIGNGPSLRIYDLEKMKEYHTFASNEIFTLFNKTTWRPEFYSTYDIETYRFYPSELSAIDSMFCFHNYSGKKYLSLRDNQLFLFIDTPYVVDKRNSLRPYISKDISNRISDGRTVTFLNIQIAIYMGFKTIYLVGVDHNYSHTVKRGSTGIEIQAVQDYCSDIKVKSQPVQYLDNTTEAYLTAKKYCEQNGIHIYNATRGGKLEVFDRITLEEAIESCEAIRKG